MLNSSFGFSFIYCIYLILCILYPSIPLFGGLSVRHVFSIIMLVPCLQYDLKKPDWFVRTYILFVFFYLIAGISSGYFLSTLSTLLGTYLAAIVLYSSTKIMVVKYDKLKLISFLLLFVFVLDAVVSIGQYYQIPHFIILPQLIGIDLGDEFMELFDRAGNFTMDSQVLAGLFGTVTNGYILSAATILAWYPFKGKYVVINIVAWSTCIMASFYAQERSGFYLAVLCSLFLIYLKFKANGTWGKILIFLIIIIVLVYGSYLIEAVISTGRYTKGTDNSGRYDLMVNGIQFVLSNPLGGVDSFKETHPVMPHNLIVNMFLAGGIVGGIIILFVVIKQCLLLIRYIFKSFRRLKWLPLLFGLMYLDFTGNSLFHNMSIVFGDPLFFVFWGVCACYVEKNTLPLQFRKEVKAI